MATASSDPNRNQLSSLKRGLQTLALLNARDGLTVTQAARELKLPRATAHRILDTLAATGYAEKLAYTSTYKITPVAGTLSNKFSDASWIVHMASPVLLNATQQLKWSFSISTLEGEHMVVRLSTDRGSVNAITYFSPGVRNSVLHTVCGHVTLAYAEDEDRDNLIFRLSRSTDRSHMIARIDPVTHETTGQPLAELNAAPDGEIQVRTLVDGIVQQTRMDGYCHIVGRSSIEGAVAVPIRMREVVKGALVMRYIKSAVPVQQIRDHFVPILQEMASVIVDNVEQMKAQYSVP